MCMFSVYVEKVSNTKIFVQNADNVGRQVTVYSNRVKLHHGEPTAMILPVPGAAENIRVFNMLAATDFFQVLGSYFPVPYTVVKPEMITFSAPPNALGPLPVQRSGVYRYSVVPALEDFSRLDTSIFQFPSQLQELLSSLYSTGFCFLACIIDASAELVPIAYEHMKLSDGRLFVPTVHFHGKPAGQKEVARKGEDKAHWDHEIYSIGASDMYAGDKARDNPQGVIAWKDFASRVPFPMPAWIPTRQLRLLRINGYRPNGDIIWEAESSLTSALDVCSAAHTGRKHVEQPWYMCITCSTPAKDGKPAFNISEGCCVACATKCHAGHSLAFAGCTPFFCDCGIRDAGCRAMHSNSDPDISVVGKPVALVVPLTFAPLACPAESVGDPVTAAPDDLEAFFSPTHSGSGSATSGASVAKQVPLPVSQRHAASAVKIPVPLALLAPLPQRANVLAQCFNNVGLRFLRNSAERDKVNKEERSVWISPFSLGAALMMLTSLLGPPAATELLSVIGLGDIADVSSVLEAARAILARFCPPGSFTSSLCVANSAWIRDDLAATSSCRSMLNDRFNAEFGTIPAATLSGKNINEWVSTATKGSIPSAVPGYLESTFVFALVNALYFKGKWEYCFHAAHTRSGVSFYNSTGTIRKCYVNMMTLTNDALLCADLPGIGKAVRLPYARLSGNPMLSCSAIIILPPRGPTPEESLAAIQAGGGLHASVGNKLRFASVALSLPRLNEKSSLSLKSDLQHLGVSQAFSYEESGLSTSILGPTAKLPISVSQVLQSVSVVVDEEGTVAAAATAIMMDTLGAGGPTVDFNMVVDRPFLFFIQESSTNLIAFAGVVWMPPESTGAAVEWSPFDG